MDPNANLEEQIELVSALNEILENAPEAEEPMADGQLTELKWRAGRLAELVEAINGWLSKGGFLPTRWARSTSTEEEVRTCATCGNDAGEDWETVDDEYQEITCQSCKAKKAEAKQNEA